MSEPLFLQSVMQEKSGVEPSYVMSLVTTFQVKKSGNTGPSQPIQMVSLKLPMVALKVKT